MSKCGANRPQIHPNMSIINFHQHKITGKSTRYEMEISVIRLLVEFFVKAHLDWSYKIGAA